MSLFYTIMTNIMRKWQRKSVLNIHWKDWCWSWNSNTLATWWEELTHRKRPWCRERLKVGGEGNEIGWDCWMASLIWCTWIWVSSGSWWWTGKSGMLQSMGSQRVSHDWAIEPNWSWPLNWLEIIWFKEGYKNCCKSHLRGILNPLSGSMLRTLCFPPL